MKHIFTVCRRIGTRINAFLLLCCLSCESARADLPAIEPPKSGGGGGLLGQAKGYAQDGIVIGGLILSAVAFFKVASAAVETFSEVRDGKSTWTQFGAIVVVGVVLLVAVIWLLSKSASIIF
ncbi:MULTISPECIES: TIGR03745 family integrating conjugative element membrane protein [Xenorhabdus]|uniref:Integrating conjugative element membrane protein n=3 Tax=Xenorhabdus TaxID=626 RepID=A0A2D0IM25_9GAMM|nr:MULTISPECIES: TIGR03745 family integrating conjugative element membrane protein [Xenorhabdus]MDC9589556.1 TIGR03745 family integrating conjugative element membrane protein [Xenorhabdus yunnanensis]MDC9597815.1 TIGR03745 family integrating conjugative element membrane protein [Xenorhabdus anantnagensis]PHM22827.1 integrating conjugative element membrane protein [Xenorhabdus ehlersii]RKE93129.1 integrating conjugative element membrane protein (TIGR03745 family) [Xenorhabdus ehlersii]